MSHLAPSHYVWWLAGRSAGIVAFMLVSVSVTLGLAMAARVVSPRSKRAVVHLHEHVALIGLAAIVAHALLLMADPWLHPGLKGTIVPFTMSYRPLWSGLGIVAAYLAAILGLSFYVRRRLRPGMWRKMHRLTILVYLLGAAHALGAGTDATTVAMRAVLLASAGPILFLLVLRTWRGRIAAGRAAASRPAASGQPSPRKHASRLLAAADNATLRPRTTEAGGVRRS